MSVTVLLPTLNEALSIAQTIVEIKEYLPEAKIVVIDGLSTDKTVEIASIFGNVSVMLVKEKGKGIAIRKALETVKSDYTIMLDADYTYPARYLPEIVCSLKLGYQTVLGYRKYRVRGAMTPVNAFGNRCLSLLASLVYGRYVHDVCTGMWGFDTYALQRLTLQSDGFTLEADLFRNAVKNKYKIKQIPIIYRARLNGSKTKLNIGHGFEIACFLLKSRLILDK